MQIAPGRALDMPSTPGELLDQTTRLDVERKLHPGQPRSQLPEEHHARVRDPLSHMPLHAIIRTLSHDLGIELPRPTPNPHRERHIRAVLLRDPLDPVHEVRPLLKLSPLVIDVRDWQRDVDALLNRHPTTLPDPTNPAVAVLALLIATPTKRQRLLQRALENPT